jgi:large subunit ribosomal protein L35
MPKMKVNPGAKKRYSLTGTGKLKRKHAYKSHLLTKKSKKRKRNLGYYSEINKDNSQSARHLLALK